MRNLKRALSLGLTAAMISGLMVMGSSAASYNDSESIQNQTAVEILGEIGAMVGDDQGNFNPDQDVTRAEMAVIITRILYGNNLNVDQFKGMNIFSDVPSWAEGFVNLCASLDIVAGVGGDKFDPNATVTTAQASLMLSRALGYFQNTAEFGNDWALSAVRRATQVGIIGGDMVLQANEGLSRDDVAQMTFNTLTKAVPVQYNELLDVYYNENKGITYSLTFYYTDTLGYQNFDLVYRTGDNGSYGRPATTWGTGSYRSSSATTVGNDDYGLNEDGSLKPELVKMTSEDEIITVEETPDYTYTANTKENVIYNAVGRSVINDYAWEAYVDGTEQSDVSIPDNDRDTKYIYTDKGATTEIYVDDVNEEVTVVKINYYMGEVTNIREDENGEYASVRILSQKTNETVDGLSDVVDERDIYCEGFAEDDYVVVTVDVNDDGDSFIASIDYPETVEGTVTRVREDSDPEKDQGDYLKMDDDAKYTYSKWTASDLDEINTIHPTLDIDYRLYLDPNGYVIGFIALDDYYANYLYIEDADEYLGTIEAKATFTDGRSEVVTIDDEYVDGSKVAYRNLIGQAYAYSEDDGTYTLRQIQPMNTTRPAVPMFENYKDVAENVNEAGAEINNGVAYIKFNGTKYIVDADTEFVDVDENAVYTGFENVPDYKKATAESEDVKFWAIDTREDDGVLDVVFIYSGEASNDNKTYFYVVNEDDYETYDKNKMYKEHVVYVDGEETTLIFNQTAHSAINSDGLYCVETTNGDGIVTKVTRISNADFQDVLSVGTRSFALANQNADQWVVNDDTIFAVVTYDLKDDGVNYKDADVRVGALKDMKDDEAYETYVYVAKPDDSDDPAELVYIVDVEIPEGSQGGGSGTSAVARTQYSNLDVNDRGTITANFTLSNIAPWVDTNYPIDVTGEIMVNGAYYDDFTVTLSAGRTSQRLTLVAWSGIDENDTIELRNVTAVAKYVKTQFVVEGTTQAPAMIGTSTYSIPTTGDAPISFTLDDSVYDKNVVATVKISGVTNPMSNGFVNPGTTWNSSKSLEYTATGDGYVVVTVGDLEARNTWKLIEGADLTANEKAALSVTTTAGSDTPLNKLGLGTDFDDTLSIKTDWNGTAALSQYNGVDFTATIKRVGGDREAISYTVTLETTNGPIVFDNIIPTADGTGKGTVTATLTMPNADVTITDIKVEVKVPLIAVESVVANSDNTITVNFNTAAENSADADLTDANFVVKDEDGTVITVNDVEMSNNNKTATLILNAAASTAATVEIKNVENALDDWGSVDTITSVTKDV